MRLTTEERERLAFYVKTYDVRTLAGMLLEAERSAQRLRGQLAAARARRPERRPPSPPRSML